VLAELDKMENLRCENVLQEEIIKIIHSSFFLSFLTVLCELSSTLLSRYM